ncbi:hypothetical protein HA466_0299030 [Hirschfeldia incana]|nr:hypothetical protein HA466_0299030 [Hirschfeldia incana]
MESMTPVSCPTTPRLNQDRPFLAVPFHQATSFLHETRANSKLADLKRFPSDSFKSSGVELAICCYDTPVRELIDIDDLLSALVGVEGRYVSIKRFPGKEDSTAFQVDPPMDLALQASGTQHRLSSFLSLGNIHICLFPTKNQEKY